MSARVRCRPHLVSSPAAPDLSLLSPLASALATTIARVAGDVALVIDADGVIRSAAEGAAAVPAPGLGWVGQRWVDTATADTRRKIELLMDEVQASGLTRRREVNHPAADGSIPLTWTAIRLGDGGPVLAVGRDLRAVAAIQQRLVDAQQDIERHYWNRRQAEARYRQLFQVASDGVVVLEGRRMTVLESNAAGIGLLGLPVDRVTGCTLVEELPPALRPAVAELLVVARNSGRAGEIRLRPRAGAGALDISVTPFRSGDEQHLMLRVRRDESTADTGDRTLATMAEYVETTPDAVVITDSSGRIRLANPAFVRMAGHADESATRGQLLTTLFGDGDGGWRRLIANANSAGIVSRARITVRVAGLPARLFDASAVLMTEGEQACLGFTLRPANDPVLQAALPDELVQSLADLTHRVGRVPLSDLLEEMNARADKWLISQALNRAGGLQTVAAEMLGLTPEVLVMRMQQHGLTGHVLPEGPGATPPSIN